MMPHRKTLPQRRANFTFDVKFWNQPWAITVGLYQSGDPGEVFVNAKRTPGTDLDAMARDAAILLSLCLQFGVPLETIRGALTRNADGSPSSIMGLICEQLGNR